MMDDWCIRGRVISGAGQGAYFTQLDWVRDQCLSKLGFDPYPGTLNVEVTPEDLPLIKEWDGIEAIELIPPDPQFCTGRALPAEIGGLAGALILPEEAVRIHGRRVLEVIAGIGLKVNLNLKDGDRVTLVVKRPTSPQITAKRG